MSKQQSTKNRNQARPSSSKQDHAPISPANDGGAEAVSVSASASQQWVLLAGLLALTFMLYLPALSNGFTNWDDGEYILENKYLALTAEHLPLLFTHNVVGNIHPLTMLSLGIDHAFGGVTDAFPYHLTNVLLHLLNVALVFFLALRLSRNQTVVALITALFFAIHPMHVESVAWISARKDVLYTAFFVGSLLWYLQYKERGHWWLYTLAFLAALASGLSKPAAVVLPVVMLLVDFYQGRLSGVKTWLEKIPFFILSLALGFVTIRAQSQAMHHDSYSFGEKLVVGMYGYVTYILKAFWWGKMSPFYPYPEDKFNLPGTFYTYIPLFLLILGAAWWGLRKNKTVFFGLAFYTVTIALVLKVVTIGAAIMAERYTYVPYIGLFFILGCAFARLSSGFTRQAAAVALALFAVACGYQTFQQTKVWKDTVTLFTQAIDHYPEANLPYINRAGEYRTRKQYELSLKDYNMADKVEPNYLLGIKGRALLLFDMKRYTEALKDFETLVNSGSQEALIFGKRGACLTYLQRYQDAIDSYNQGLVFNPDDGDIYNDRASNYFHLKEYEKAIADYTKSIELKADHTDMLRNRGATYLLMARYEDALADFDACIQKGNPPAVVHYYRSAALNKLGRKEDARAAAQLAASKGYVLPAGYLE